MIIKQIYTNCLSQASYYIESEGEAIIIDPIRDSSLYINLLEKRKAKLKYIFETAKPWSTTKYEINSFLIIDNLFKCSDKTAP